MMVIKGVDVAKKMAEKMQESIEALEGKVPCLAIVRVGERPDDMAYERGAVKKLTSLGIECKLETYAGDITQEEFMEKFDKVNNDDAVHGILLLRPLPAQLDVTAVERTILPRKDVDGMGHENTVKIYLGAKDGFAPCTPRGVIEILDHLEYDLQGKNVVIVGCGNVVGKPLSLLMMARNATVTICNEFTKDLADRCQKADVLVSAAGVQKLIKAQHVNPDCIVIDVGINVNAEGKLCGDVDYDAVAPIVKGITPVPGGVGSVTTSVLAKHVVRAAERS